ncbi:MAG: hypothetical protein ACR2ID_10415 [Chthoniobacterales bacterium]
MRRPGSLAEVASHTASARDFGMAIAEFLDQFGIEKSERMLATEPPLTCEALRDEGVGDAYLAAVAVELSRSIAASPPAWSYAQRRFLRSPWFADTGPALRATLLLESPAGFRERNLFVSENALSRA